MYRLTPLFRALALAALATCAGTAGPVGDGDAGSSRFDGGVPDSGAVDSGEVDAGQADAGAARQDGGVPDSGSPDSGVTDAGPTDAGTNGTSGDGGFDSGVVDSGVVDAGLPDAGPGDAGCARPPTSALIVNVKDRGARGDGVTNDTDAIQAAIDEVAGTGGTVLVPDGTYLIQLDRKPYAGKFGLEVKASMTFRMSPAAILKAIPLNNGSYGMIKVFDSSNVNIVGGTLVGDRDSFPSRGGEWGMGISIEGSSAVVIDGVVAKDFWGDGFYVAGGDPALGPLQARDITLCRVVSDHNRRQGISIIHASNVTIRDSSFRNTVGTLPESGIDIEPEPGNLVDHVTIEGSQFLDNAGDGVQCGAPFADMPQGAVLDVTVRRNVMRGNGRMGARLSNFRRCTLSSNLVEDSGQDGLLMDQVSDAGISDNVIRRSGERGLELIRASQNNTFTGNFIEASSQSANAGFENIVLWSDPANGVLANNTFRANQVRAGSQPNRPRVGVSVSTDSCVGNTFVDNDFKDAGSDVSFVDHGLGTRMWCGDAGACP